MFKSGAAGGAILLDILPEVTWTLVAIEDLAILGGCHLLDDCI